jgi:hypothetical protein
MSNTQNQENTKVKTENKFPKGLFVEETTFANGNTIQKLGIRVAEFTEWLNEKQNAKGFVNLDLNHTKLTEEDLVKDPQAKPHIYAIDKTFHENEKSQSK